jgi:glycine/D-amino acid oxidase-like deaminating enzyme
MTDGRLDAIVAGGGIVGAACAAALARAGMRVALVERGAIASGATSAGMGHSVVMDDSPAQFALTRYSQQLWASLAPHLGPDAEFAARGTLWIAADEEEMAEAERKHAYYGERGVPTRLLSADELAAAEPNLRPGLHGALLVQEDAIVHPPAVAVHLAEEARALGATLLMGHGVTRLADGQAILDDGGRLAAPRLVNAAGPWAPELTAGLPVRKRKGHLVRAGFPVGFVGHQLVELGYLKSAHAVTEDSVAFNVQPRASGQLLIGSSRQFVDESQAPNQPVLDAMLVRAAAYMPALGRLESMEVWTGFRAATPDKLPLIGPSATDPTLWIATGHEGLGITTSLGTAALLAACLADVLPPIPIEPYLPARFVQPEQWQAQKETPCNGQA